MLHCMKRHKRKPRIHQWRLLLRTDGGLKTPKIVLSNFWMARTQKKWSINLIYRWQIERMPNCWGSCCCCCTSSGHWWRSGTPSLSLTLETRTSDIWPNLILREVCWFGFEPKRDSRLLELRFGLEPKRDSTLIELILFKRELLQSKIENTVTI